MKDYYDTRAPEYDEWYLGLGRFAERERPGWHEAVSALEQAVQELAPARTLDVACGTGFLTRNLRGPVTGLDQSDQMIEIARERMPAAEFVQADAIPLPFSANAFDRVFTGHFYGHLGDTEREAFLADARRVAPELIVVDSAVRPDHEREEVQAANPQRRLRLRGLQAVLRRRRAGARARRRNRSACQRLVRDGRLLRGELTRSPQGDGRLARGMGRLSRVGAILSACVLGATLSISSPAAAAGPVRLGSAPAVPEDAHIAGALATSMPLHVTVTLKPRNPARLAAFAEDVSTPGSPLYRDYITPAQFAQRFGATPDAVQAVESSLKAHGLVPGPVSANSLSIRVTATAGQLSPGILDVVRARRARQRQDAIVNQQAPSLDPGSPATYRPCSG